jgi:hypothetical protein
MSKETDLGGHSQDGKRFHPPFKKLERMKLTSWRNQSMPEILWAVLVRGNLERNEALDFFRYVSSFVERNPEYADITLSGIAKHSPEKQKVLIKHIAGWSPKVCNLLQSMLVFPDLPGIAEWTAILGEPDQRTVITNLATAVKEVLWHQSEPATDCRWIKFLCFIHSGKMKFFSSIPGIKDTIRGVYEYPNYGDVTHVQGFIRAGDLRIMIEEQDTTWVKHFWDECYRKTSCIPESTEQKFPTSQSCEGHIDDGNVTAPWIEIYAPETEGWEDDNEKQREWKIENLKQQKRMLKMLDEFYQDRKTPLDVVLSFRNIGAFGGFRVQSNGAEIMPVLSFEEQKNKLDFYRNEMKGFTEFLKNKLEK